jgi:hypothetical protein
MTALSAFVLVVVSCAVAMTVHVLTSLAIARRTSPMRGAVALFVPPFAPYFAIRSRALAWATVWCTAMALYTIAFVIACRWR